MTIIAVEGLLRPEIQAVDIAMPEIERPLMGLKGSSFLICRRDGVDNGKTSTDHNTRSGAERHQIGLCYNAIELVCCERLAVNGDVYLVIATFERDRRRLQRKTQACEREPPARDLRAACFHLSFAISTLYAGGRLVSRYISHKRGNFD